MRCSDQDVSTDSADSGNPLLRKLSSASVQPSVPTNFKTELCKNFEAGRVCKWGANCCFAHGKSELRTRALREELKSKSCRGFNESGVCSYGLRCQFQHFKSFRQFREGLEMIECSLGARMDTCPTETLEKSLLAAAVTPGSERLRCFANLAASTKALRYTA